MSSHDRKRIHNAKNITPKVQKGNVNTVIALCHKYSNMSTVTVMAEDFPIVPVTPCKSLAAKKALYGLENESPQDIVVIHTLSKHNSLKFEGLKIMLDFACSEIKDTQKRVYNVNTQLKEEEQKLSKLLTRISDLESYSIRWNLKLYGIRESPYITKSHHQSVFSVILQRCTLEGCKNHPFLRDNKLRLAEDLSQPTK